MSNEDGTESQFSDADLSSVITEDNLRDSAQALHDCQTRWEKLEYMATKKIPCNECSGAGTVAGGSMGDICVNCFGTRMVEAPDAEDFEMPDFAKMRRAIGGYGDALADRALPDGHRAKKGLALPAATGVPTLAEIKALDQKAKDMAKSLASTGNLLPGGVDTKALPKPKKAKGLAGDGDLGDYTDAELDEHERDTDDDL